MSVTELSMVEIFWCTVFSLMLTASVFGNFMIIWIVLAHRRMRTVTNFFLLNLSLADFLMASLNGVPNFVYMVLRNWIFGSVLCVVNNFVANLTVGLSAFTMVAVSADRYIAIVRPLEPRMTKGMARRVIAVIWICSAIIAFPCLIYSEKFEYESDGSLKSACILRLESGMSPFDSKIDLAYNVCFLVITYVIPILGMGVCYSAIIYTLWGHKQIGETAAHTQTSSMASKRKSSGTWEPCESCKRLQSSRKIELFQLIIVSITTYTAVQIVMRLSIIVRMFIVIVSTFAICWLPYHAYFIYTNYDHTIVYEEWIQHLYLSFYWLAMSTSMINPIIYYLMNTRFRSYIQEFILKCLLCRRSQEPPRAGGRQLRGNPGLLRQCSQSCSGEDGQAHPNFKRKTMVMMRTNFHESNFGIPLEQLNRAENGTAQTQNTRLNSRQAEPNPQFD